MNLGAGRAFELLCFCSTATARVPDCIGGQTAAVLSGRWVGDSDAQAASTTGAQRPACALVTRACCCSSPAIMMLRGAASAAQPWGDPGGVRPPGPAHGPVHKLAISLERVSGLGAHGGPGRACASEHTSAGQSRRSHGPGPVNPNIHCALGSSRGGPTQFHHDGGSRLCYYFDKISKGLIQHRLKGGGGGIIARRMRQTSKSPTGGECIMALCASESLERSR